MLRSLKALEGYTVHATDGDIGKVVNFLMDDERWSVRYLVVDTGSFLEGRRVLVSPISFREVDWAPHRFHLDLTMDKVKNSPSIDVDKPVSRQHERDYLRYYDYSSYWGYSGLWGMGAYPSLLMGGAPNHPPADVSDEPPGNVHLLRAPRVLGERPSRRISGPLRESCHATVTAHRRPAGIASGAVRRDHDQVGGLASRPQEELFDVIAGFEALGGARQPRSSERERTNPHEGTRA
jgi:hypothetical protein